MKEHHVIIVPGLNNGVKLRKIFASTKTWDQYGLFVTVHIAPWDDQDFATKIAALLKKIDTLVAQGHQVSLIGISAGGSLVMNAYLSRKKYIHKVVTICARLRIGSKKFPDIHFAKRFYPAYAESVLFCESGIARLNMRDKKNIMTVRGVIDELVPVTTMIINDATNICLPIGIHFLVMAYALTIDKKKIINFLKN